MFRVTIHVLYSCNFYCLTLTTQAQYASMLIFCNEEKLLKNPSPLINLNYIITKKGHTQHDNIIYAWTILNNDLHCKLQIMLITLHNIALDWFRQLVVLTKKGHTRHDNIIYT
jgi:hypothetical protein